MVVRSIVNEIICEYKDVCNKYSACNKDSICPDCRNNKWVDPESLKKCYFKPKVTMSFILSMGFCFICLFIYCWFCR